MQTQQIITLLTIVLITICVYTMRKESTGATKTGVREGYISDGAKTAIWVIVLILVVGATVWMCTKELCWPMFLLQGLWGMIQALWQAAFGG